MIYNGTGGVASCIRGGANYRGPVKAWRERVRLRRSTSVVIWPQSMLWTFWTIGPLSSSQDRLGMAVVHGIGDVECSVCWARSGGNWTRRFRLFAGPGASPQVDEIMAGWRCRQKGGA